MLALKRSAERCPRGSFRLKEKSSRRVETGFDFLGYNFWRDARGKVAVSPSERNTERFSAKIKPLLKECRVSSYNRPARVDALRALRCYIESWCAGFSLAPNVRQRAFRPSIEQAGAVAVTATPMIRQAFAEAFGAEFVRKVEGPARRLSIPVRT
jgi:hypothetical protein